SGVRERTEQDLERLASAGKNPWPQLTERLLGAYGLRCLHAESCPLDGSDGVVGGKRDPRLHHADIYLIIIVLELRIHLLVQRESESKIPSAIRNARRESAALLYVLSVAIQEGSVREVPIGILRPSNLGEGVCQVEMNVENDGGVLGTRRKLEAVFEGHDRLLVVGAPERTAVGLLIEIPAGVPQLGEGPISGDVRRSSIDLLMRGLEVT